MQDIQPDSASAAMIAPYKMALDSQMQAIVGIIGEDMRRQKPESTLGNFICDMLLAESIRVSGKQVDFACYNYGGIRQEFLNKGPVTKGKIYELLPFENFGAIVTMDGPATRQLIDKIIVEGGWPVSAGFKVVVQQNQVKEIFIGGQPFDLNRSYTVAMNDYMANGGDKMPFIQKDKVQVLGTTVRDMMLHYLGEMQAKGESAHAQIEGRIVYAD